MELLLEPQGIHVDCVRSPQLLLEALGQDPRLAPAPVLERQADQRSDEWVDRYREEAERKGLPT